MGIRDNARTTGPAVEAMYRFILWLVPTVEKFPRRQRFLLGDRIQATALDVLERLVEATYTIHFQGEIGTGLKPAPTTVEAPVGVGFKPARRVPPRGVVVWPRSYLAAVSSP